MTVWCKNASFKIFVGVIPKRRIGDWGPPILLLVWHQIYNILVICEGCILQICSRCRIKRRTGRTPSAKPSFGMATTKILKDTFLQHTQHNWFFSFSVKQYCNATNQEPPNPSWMQLSLCMHKMWVQFLFCVSPNDFDNQISTQTTCQNMGFSYNCFIE